MFSPGRSEVRGWIGGGRAGAAAAAVISWRRGRGHGRGRVLAEFVEEFFEAAECIAGEVRRWAVAGICRRL